MTFCPKCGEMLRPIQAVNGEKGAGVCDPCTLQFTYLSRPTRMEWAFFGDKREGRPHYPIVAAINNYLSGLVGFSAFLDELEREECPKWLITQFKSFYSTTKEAPKAKAATASI